MPNASPASPLRVVSIGLGMVAAAKQKRPKKLVALDLVDWKLDVAKKVVSHILKYIL